MNRSRHLLLAGIPAVAVALATAGAGTLASAATQPQAPAGSTAVTCSALHGPSQSSALSRQHAFRAASTSAGVPSSVLLAVSYMESRWDDHNGSPSTSGGYGPFNLTHVDLAQARSAKGDGNPLDVSAPAALNTLRLASRLTGLSPATLRTDPAANICGGAAVLAHYQQRIGAPTGATTAPGRWYAAVAKYSGATDQGTAQHFADQVFRVLRTGDARTTNDGQRVRLAAHPQVQPRSSQLSRLDLTAAPAQSSAQTDCPADLDCWWIPAPYEQYGPNPWDYGNHDLANRPDPSGPTIDYIVIHDTEGSFQTALNLVQQATYLGWNYTIRSSDGQVAQHMHANDIGWQAGNWYVNMHSMGVEHEGFAAHGATWYTEAMYENSADLVRYLALKYNVPLDRAHIIGHEQVPGITPAYVAGMHWDPGPYWNWEHYFKLLQAPIGSHTTDGSTATYTPGEVVTVEPRFAKNRQLVTGCDQAGQPCPAQGTNFVYLRQAPSESAPLVKDEGLHPGGGASTTDVADWGPRAAAGQQLVVAGQQGDWVAVWWSGAIAWLHNPVGHEVIAPTKVSHPQVWTVSAKPGASSVPVYGRAYPEASAYPSDIPVQDVVPLQYTIKAGQAYVLADKDIQTDYYRAVTFNCQGPDDCTDVQGQDKYYEIWFGHRMVYVRAADVQLTPAG